MSDIKYKSSISRYQLPTLPTSFTKDRKNVERRQKLDFCSTCKYNYSRNVQIIDNSCTKVVFPLLNSNIPEYINNRERGDNNYGHGNEQHQELSPTSRSSVLSSNAHLAADHHQILVSRICDKFKYPAYNGVRSASDISTCTCEYCPRTKKSHNKNMNVSAMVVDSTPLSTSKSHQLFGIPKLFGISTAVNEKYGTLLGGVPPPIPLPKFPSLTHHMSSFSMIKNQNTSSYISVNKTSNNNYMKEQQNSNCNIFMCNNCE